MTGTSCLRQKVLDIFSQGPIFVFRKSNAGREKALDCRNTYTFCSLVDNTKLLVESNVRVSEVTIKSSTKCTTMCQVGKREALVAYLIDTDVPAGAQRVLGECFDKGWVKGGPRVYYVVLEKRNAPDENEAGRTSRSETDGPFWGNGSERQQVTIDVLHACMSAGFLYVLEGDVPKRSIVGTVMEEARSREIQYFGGQGASAAVHTIPLTKDFVDAWNVGDISSRLVSDTLTCNMMEVATLNVSLSSTELICIVITKSEQDNMAHTCTDSCGESHQQ